MFTRAGRRDGSKTSSSNSANISESDIVSSHFPYISPDSEIHRSNEPNFPARGENSADEQAQALFALPGGRLW